MTENTNRRSLSRRTLLSGGAGLAGAAVLRLTDARPHPWPAPRRASLRRPRPSPTRKKTVHLVGTDGWVVDAGRRAGRPALLPGLAGADALQHLRLRLPRRHRACRRTQVAAQRGKAQISAPMLAFDEEDDITITLTNLGLLQRPDLFDGHTLHWHGFVNAIPLFDGVPELSLAVPVGRDFTYFYRPHDAGTYMYHCHFEDVEHVQMGMTGHGLRPAEAEQATPSAATRSARSTPTTTATGPPGYDREFAFMITELWSAAHYRDAHIQVSDWTDFDPSFWLLNGRGYPDTARAQRQPAASPTGGPAAVPADLVAGHLQHRRPGAAAAVQPGLPEPRDDGRQHRPDRSSARTPACCKGRDGTTNYLTTNTVDVGPGESRDVHLHRARARASTCSTTATTPTSTTAAAAGYGGMMTEIVV